MNSHRRGLGDRLETLPALISWELCYIFKFLSTWELIFLVWRHALLSHLDARRKVFQWPQTLPCQNSQTGQDFCLCWAGQAPMSSRRQIAIVCSEEGQDCVLLAWARSSELSSHTRITGDTESQSSCVYSGMSPWPPPHSPRDDRRFHNLCFETYSKLCLYTGKPS